MTPAALQALASADPDGLEGAGRLVSSNPARALGLADLGVLRAGERADLFVTDRAGRAVLTLSESEVIHHIDTLDLSLASQPARAPFKKVS
ncbi:amidohydrolase family protein [Jannaschia seohaensis]|uniref:N-acetylglucosamine-6-phosphate deacetylase n=1 Tax=Jannaschia seohaensis TaxID=475081 RepID=A0A2Y9AQI4_9RHOB|nr:amidohydrolase family protein [Jannaschia seohaensis]PWJ18119.1 N-acetylglucosamine-6-phosphate deacetylase [Jannaschia seohaensis]SSA46644.1 N-acetylglucosamine-6-phosphate deacetylase [Jannaschia seohaensis]